MCCSCTPGFTLGWPFKFFQTPQSRRELRQQSMAAVGALESGEKEPSIQATTKDGTLD